MDLLKKELIKTIIIDKANFEHIAKTGNINGTLLIEIERVMTEYVARLNEMAHEAYIDDDKPFKNPMPTVEEYDSERMKYDSESGDWC